jgi:hypothetical protein
MRKLHFIVAVLILAIGLISCEKQNKHDLGIDAMKAAKVTYMVGDLPGPASDNGIEPVIIPGENNGGNRTCEEVWLALGDPDDVCGIDYLCGDKIDYEEDGGGFVSDFPEGLKVTVSGIYISFEVDDCLEIDGKSWKVGAVIVKGSNAANVYWYPDGETSDAGLAAPGGKRMVSNLTFCFVPCEPEKPADMVIAFKTSIKDKVLSERLFAYTAGDEPVPVSDPPPVDFNNGIPMGFYELGFGEDFSLDLISDGSQVGTITATQIDVDGVPNILVEVELDNVDHVFSTPYLYVGSEAGLLDLNYWEYPFDNTDADPLNPVCTFLIPEADITW